MQAGWVRIGDYRQITGYISKTVNDRHPVTVFIERFRAAVSVLIGPCCPALLNRIHANVYTVVLLGK